MSKKSRNRSQRRRVTTANTNRRLPTLSLDSIRIGHQFDLEDFLPVEDRRVFHPEGDLAPPRTTRGTTSRLVVAEPARSLPSKDMFAHLRVPSGVQFEQPDVLICVRRQQRKEVLHATNKAGKRGQKSPRRSAFSDIKC